MWGVDDGCVNCGYYLYVDFYVYFDSFVYCFIFLNFKIWLMYEIDIFDCFVWMCEIVLCVLIEVDKIWFFLVIGLVIGYIGLLRKESL